MAHTGKLSYDDVKDVITVICKENLSQDDLLIQLGDIQTYLKIEKDVEVITETIREYGIRDRGYFEKKYPEACSYNNDTDSKYRGLMVKPQKFIQAVET